MIFFLKATFFYLEFVKILNVSRKVSLWKNWQKVTWKDHKQHQ